MKNIIFILLGALYFYLVFLYFGKESVTWYLESIYIPEFVFSIVSVWVIFMTLFSWLSLLENILSKWAHTYAKKTDSNLDDMILDIVLSSTHVLKYLAAFYISWQFISVPESVDSWVREFSSIFLLVVLLLFVTKLINLTFNQKFIDESKMKAMSRSLMPFVRKAIVALVWIIGIITIISNLWYDVTALIAWAWVWGIAVALAAQNSITNIFGAITILMNKPFTLGDYVTVNGHTGTVKDIGLSYITLIDRNGHTVMIPNANIISSSIENETKRNFRRADFSIGLTYDTTLAGMQKWVKIIEEILEWYVEEKLLQKYRVNFEAFWDFSLNIFVTYFSNTTNYDEFVKEKEEINLEIKSQFGKAKLEMAFPTSEMIIKKGEL